MMNAAFAELGMDWRYVHLPISPALFAETARALPRSGYRGANVTIPHKVAAHDLAGELSAAARAIGAVNTLVFEEDGGIAGHNTDAGGFLDALGSDPAGRRALVLGAGGAARAVAWALREKGADVAVWNRTRDRAAQLAETLGVRLSEQGEPAEILVNATSVGLDARGSGQRAAAGGRRRGGRPGLRARGDPARQVGSGARHSSCRRSRDPARPGGAELRALDLSPGSTRRPCGPASTPSRNASRA